MVLRRKKAVFVTCLFVLFECEVAVEDKSKVAGVRRESGMNFQ